MNSIKEIMAGPAISGYRGSETTRDMVSQAIAERWGEDEVENYDPERNCLTFSKWLSQGFVPRKGEKAIRSITFVEKEDDQGKVIATYKRTVFLFYYKQVQKVQKQTA